MTELPIYILDAFTDRQFGGNPAAVCILDQELDEVTMQSIAAQNNLAETAFLLGSGAEYTIRWFTPLVEVDLCGHASLASAWVIFKTLDPGSDKLCFHSRSGELHIHQDGDFLSLDFPSDHVKEAPAPEMLIESLGSDPLRVYKGRSDYLLEFENESEIRKLAPDFQALKQVNARGIIVTAPGEDVDFVSRFFAPSVGINEDPVTGSAHTSLTPFWSKKLNKTKLEAIQLSPRSGRISCTYLGERVLLKGQVQLYSRGTIFLHQ